MNLIFVAILNELNEKFLFMESHAKLSPGKWITLEIPSREATCPDNIYILEACS